MESSTSKPRRSARQVRSFGQGMTEYIIIVALIAIAAIGVVTLFGDQIRNLFTSTEPARTDSRDARREEKRDDRLDGRGETRNVRRGEVRRERRSSDARATRREERRDDKRDEARRDADRRDR